MTNETIMDAMAAINVIVIIGHLCLTIKRIISMELKLYG